jgi:hypothetical protein
MDDDARARRTARQIIEGLIKPEIARAGAKSGTVRLTTYVDAESFTMLGRRAGAESWSLHCAVNSYLVAGFADLGLRAEFIVVSSTEYRRWLRGRPDSEALRERYAVITEQGLPAYTSEFRTLH